MGRIVDYLMNNDENEDNSLVNEDRKCCRLDVLFLGVPHSWKFLILGKGKSHMDYGPVIKVNDGCIAVPFPKIIMFHEKNKTATIRAATARELHRQHSSKRLRTFFSSCSQAMGKVMEIVNISKGTLWNKFTFIVLK